MVSYYGVVNSNIMSITHSHRAVVSPKLLLGYILRRSSAQGHANALAKLLIYDL